jgi:hypothetical protein
MKIRDEVVWLEQIRVERLSLFQLMRISRRLSRYLAARSIPALKAMVECNFVPSDAKLQRLFDLNRIQKQAERCKSAAIAAPKQDLNFMQLIQFWSMSPTASFQYTEEIYQLGLKSFSRQTESSTPQSIARSNQTPMALPRGSIPPIG